MSNEELERRRAEIAEFKSKFPYVVIEVPGAEALASWEPLKRERLETPVVIGDDDALMTMYDPFYPTQGYTPPTLPRFLRMPRKSGFPRICSKSALISPLTLPPFSISISPIRMQNFQR